MDRLKSCSRSFSALCSGAGLFYATPGCAVSCRCGRKDRVHPLTPPEGDPTMRFMVVVKSAENAGPPPQALMAAIAKLGEEAMRASVMLETGGLLPSAMGARVRLSNGNLTVTDGPFLESKELIGGYA